MTKDKGFDKYCEIARNNSERFDFVAAGRFQNDTEGLELRNKAEISNVEILGFVDFKEFLKLVDAIVLPIQWNEPFGRVIVESALAGVEVYSNKVGGISELYDIFDELPVSASLQSPDELPDVLSSDALCGKHQKAGSSFRSEVGFPSIVR